MGKNKEYEMAIKIAGEIEESFYKSTRLTKKELREIARNASATSATLSQTFSKGLSDAAPVFGGIEKAGAAAFHAVATAATVAGAAVAAITVASTTVGASFEAQMSTVEAISGASGAEFEKLNDLAKELGATTKYTATEVGQAMEYMAMAGWKTQDMLDGMSGVLSLAAASGEDLGTTSDIVTDAMTAFGMGANEVEHFSDVLAATATNSNTNVSMMGETFTYAASLAGAMGYSIEDTAIAIGLMANSGIKASQAGTALRKIFTETVGGAKVSAAAFGQMTIATTEQDGSMRELKDITIDLREAFSQMTESEKAMNAESIAGKTGMSGLLAIVNASEADFNKLSNSVYNCAGAAEKMADIRLDNLKGDFTILTSALEGTGIQIYEDLSEPMRYAVQAATEFIGQFSNRLASNNIISDITAKIPTAVREVKQLGAAVADFSEPFFEVAGWLLDNPEVIVGTVTALGTALATYKVANGVMSLASALGALGPVGWGILAIGAVVGIITGIGVSIKKAAIEAKKANLAAHFGDISLSLSELDEIAAGIIESDSLGQVREAITAFDALEDVQRAIDDSASALKKMNWKVSIGMELEDSEKESYINEAADYAAQCQQYLTDQQFAMTLAVGVLTNNDIEGHNIVNQINDFYAGKQKELADLGTKLNETITDAFQDGLLDMDEAARISEIQADMAEIQAQLAGTDFEAGMEVISAKYGSELDAESFQNLQAELAEQAEEAKKAYEEAYQSAISGELAMMKEGAIDKATYDNNVSELRENYLDNIKGIDTKSLDFQLNTIYSQYEDEINEILPEMEEMKEELLQYADQVLYAEGLGSTADRLTILKQYMDQMIKDSGTFSEDTVDALADLMKMLQPSIDQMENTMQMYRDTDKAIPTDVKATMDKAHEIGAFTGDEKSLWATTGDVLVNDEHYREIIEASTEQGEYIPEVIGTAMKDNQAKIEEAAKTVWVSAVSYIKEEFAQGMDVETNIRIAMKPDYTDFGMNPQKMIGNMNMISSMPGYATGGIIQNPTIATFAEDGPEAAIPLDGSRNAIDLWLLTGQLLGMQIEEPIKNDGISNLSNKINNNSFINETSGPVTFSPEINFYGAAPTKEDLDDAFDSALDKFKELYREMKRQEGRFAF